MPLHWLHRQGLSYDLVLRGAGEPTRVVGRAQPAQTCVLESRGCCGEAGLEGRSGQLSLRPVWVGQTAELMLPCSKAHGFLSMAPGTGDEAQAKDVIE